MAPTTKTKAIDIAPGHAKAWQAQLTESGPEVTLIRVPISSTAVDRDGDEFSMAGLESMAAALRSGKVPLYLDHGRLPNGTRLYGALDMVGAWINGEIEGDKLYGTAFLEPGNWLGDTLIRKIDVGLPIGFSAGFWVNEAREKHNGGLIFDDVSLWEVSAVGIPSNPDAVNSAAVAAVVKSLRIKAGLEPEGDTMVDTPKKKKDPEEVDPEKDKTTKPCPDEDEDDRKKKQPEEEPDEDEEEKKQSDDDEEEEDEEEKYVEILDEKAIRTIVAEEVKKALKPIADRLTVVDEIKTLIKEEAKPTKRKTGPRAIVVARGTESVQTKNTEPAGEPDIIIP
ncbi:MAG: hypothetical protein M0P37_04355 [Synergistaceae bacterium]|nr:hypothetical protein [Synergistaceae bacterium]